MTLLSQVNKTSLPFLLNVGDVHTNHTTLAKSSLERAWVGAVVDRTKIHYDFPEHSSDALLFQILWFFGWKPNSFKHVRIELRIMSWPNLWIIEIFIYTFDTDWNSPVSKPGPLAVSGILLYHRSTQFLALQITTSTKWKSIKNKLRN